MENSQIFVRGVHGSLIAVKGGHAGQLYPGNFTLRKATATASVTLTDGDAAVLLAAPTRGVFHDLAEVTFANQSTAAANVTLKDDGSDVRTFEVPGGTTTGATYEVPIPQSAVNSAWYADMEDITGTTVTVDATFIKNK